MSLSSEATPGRLRRRAADMFRPASPNDPQWGITRGCRRIADSRRFQILSVSVILLNAVIIGIETYPSVVSSAGAILPLLDEACLTFFVLEVLLRLGAFGRRPWRFFANGWNVFDFLVVAAGLIPGLRENVTLLRIIRLARIVRVVRMFPSLRILLTAVWRSVPGAVGLIGVGVVVLYLYGMMGWILFGQELPDKFGTIGEAALTLFFLLTMDSVGTIVREGVEITFLAVPYYLSFIMFGGFVLMNLLIGVVITSMEEARSIEQNEAREESHDEVSNHELLAKLETLQRTVEQLAASQAALPAEEHPTVSARSNPPRARGRPRNGLR